MASPYPVMLPSAEASRVGAVSLCRSGQSLPLQLSHKSLSGLSVQGHRTSMTTKRGDFRFTLGS